MTGNDDPSEMSRRAVLQASGSAVGLLGAGTVRGNATGASRTVGGCPEGTVGPSMVHYDDSTETVCADDHPETETIRSEVRTALEDRYPTVGSLFEAGYVPYFDFLAADGESAWSHWINPEFVGDDSVLEPTRPESVLVDHKWWRPIGVMFVATREGERVDPPPSVYESEESDEACTPWHSHVGLPGRYSWLKYRTLSCIHTDGVDLSVPCRTPWVMHVRRYSHPESVYAHDAPPRGNRGGPPAEDAGFETDAVPGEDSLGLSVLPDALIERLEHL